MNEQQEAHFEAVMALVEPLGKAKYAAGAIEHTGVLGDLTDEQLFDAETDEIIDLLWYRLTRIHKRRTIKS